MRNTIGYHAYSMAHGLIIIIKIFVSIGEREKKCLKKCFRFEIFHINFKFKKESKQMFF
jgi:hypothetical protein